MGVWNYTFVRGGGAVSPKPANLLKSKSKNQREPAILEQELCKLFENQIRILMKINVCLIIIKEFLKPRDKIFRVWTENSWV